MKGRLPMLLLAMTCLVAGVAPLFAQGLPGVAVHNEGKAGPADRDAMKSGEIR